MFARNTDSKMIRRLTTLVFAVLSMHCMAQSSTDSLTPRMLSDKYYRGGAGKSVILRLKKNSKFTIVYSNPRAKTVKGSWSFQYGKVRLIRTGGGEYKDEKYFKLIVKSHSDGAIQLVAAESGTSFVNRFVRIRFDTFDQPWVIRFIRKKWFKRWFRKRGKKEKSSQND